MSRVVMMFRPWTSPEGVQMTPGLVDRDVYPDIPEDRFTQMVTLPWWSDELGRLQVEIADLRAQVATLNQMYADAKAALSADNERLRALIKYAEWDGQRES